YGLGLSVVEKIKLGILASIEISPKSSGGDLAAGALGGWVYYQAPDRDSMPRVLTGHTSVTDAMTGPAWLPMRARRIPTPTDIQVLIGWTGSPAETDQLVSQATSNGGGLNWDDAFLRPSAANVNSLILALADEKFPLIHAGIRTARTLLTRMAEHTATLIETPQLTTLIESAELLEGVSAKTSGAGGGDCGIVLAEPTVDPAVIYNTCQQHGIQPLHLNVTQLGVGLEEQPSRNPAKTITFAWPQPSKNNSMAPKTLSTTSISFTTRWPVLTPMTSIPASSWDLGRWIRRSTPTE